MIKTGHFKAWLHGKYSRDYIPVSIAISQPKNTYIDSLPELMPDRTTLNKYHKEQGQPGAILHYIDEYVNKINKINRDDFYKKLCRFCNEKGSNHLLFLCWEDTVSPNGDPYKTFCHRRLVAEWLHAQYNIEFPEYGHEATPSDDCLQLPLLDDNGSKTGKTIREYFKSKIITPDVPFNMSKCRQELYEEMTGNKYDGDIENNIMLNPDDYAFLSNAYECEIKHDGMTYKNAEAAFQASKFYGKTDRIIFSRLSAEQAKSIGDEHDPYPGWESNKNQILLDILKSKFKNPELAQKLISTGSANLSDSTPENLTGKTLMKLRDELQKTAPAKMANLTSEIKSNANLTSVMITGHRPASLGWGYDYSDPRWQALRHEFKNMIISDARQNNGLDCITGMALGVDTVFALAALDAKQELAREKINIMLTCAIPCQNQDSKWTPESKMLYKNILDSADEKVLVTNAPYSPQAMMDRNTWMVEHCQKAYALYNGKAGGTADAVNKLNAMNKPVTVITPAQIERQAVNNGRSDRQDEHNGL